MNISDVANSAGYQSGINTRPTADAQESKSAQPTQQPMQAQDSVSLGADGESLLDMLASVKNQAKEITSELKMGKAVLKKDLKERLHDGDAPRGYTVVKGTHAGDDIRIDQLRNGSISVSVNGKERVFDRDEAKYLVIDGGAGDDTIVASENVTTPLYILGGRGNDTIVGGKGNDYIRGGKGNDSISVRGGDNELFGDDGHDTITGGDGRDFIDGGKGNDILSGGAGNDVIYGGEGNDVIDGGAGNDFINAGRGDDTVEGGAGNDIIFGNAGDDKLSGGDGDDVLIGGAGRDTVDGGAGNDKIRVSEGGYIVADSADTDAKVLNPGKVPSNVIVSPLATERFRDHMRDDLEAMASIEPGQAMFEGLKKAGRHVLITSTKADNGFAMSFTNNGDLKENGAFGGEAVPGSGTGSVVSINPLYINMYDSSEAWSETNSMVITAHELAHAYNSATGTMDNTMYDDTTGDYSTDIDNDKAVEGAEFQAVGIHQDRVAVPNPYGISENDYRDYLGMEHRTSYYQSSDSSVD
ncbi:hypothetical protein IJT17_08500 [bacterium]|nr:hypothetical protein [bacterium]